MQTNNNINFGSIKLSNTNPFFIKRIGEHLRTKGFDPLGVAHMEDFTMHKKQALDLIRNKELKYPEEFGVAFLNNQECYIVGKTATQEAKMVKHIKEIDNKAEQIIGI